MQLLLRDNRVISFETAGTNDIEAIIELYQNVYKGKYTLPDVADPKIIAQKVEDPNYMWLLAKLKNRVVGSVIFAIDPVNKIGKSYAAAVLSEFRGQDVMRHMVRQGVTLLTSKTRSCDVIYATTRTVSFAPQVVLERIGFLPMGIFPNVRKVESFETHGLEVFLSDKCLDLRRKNPKIISELDEFYSVIKSDLKLENAELFDIEEQDPREMGEKFDFDVSENIKEISEKYYSYQNKDLMRRVFFPFTDPNMLFSSKDGSADVFVNLNRLDGNGVILGYRYSGAELHNMLMWFCEKAAKSGMRYTEMLVSAYNPQMQRMALDSRFLPCAYFPAMRMSDNGSREDYFVFSRSFEKLNFMDIHLNDTNRRFLDAFMKCWYNLLVRCQPDFDEEWRIG